MRCFAGFFRFSSLKTSSVLILLSAVLLFTSIHTLHPQENGTHPVFVSPVLFFFALCIICMLIGIFAVLGGVGGGVIFTPLMMGFTSIDSYIIRTTGLFIAMAGALIAARPYLRKGIANIRLLMLTALPNVLFSIIGAFLAVYIHSSMGETGEALIRGILGVFVIGISILFICTRKRTEYPETGTVDAFSKCLCLDMSYREDSVGEKVSYRVKRTLPGILCICLIGLTSGLFGLGAGWAIVPVFNLVMLVPLKAAAACSTVMISLGGTAAVWPYILNGGMFPILVVPCLIGMTAGAHIGSKIMMKSKPSFIRYIIIIVLLCAGIRLCTKAFSMG